MSDSLGSLRDFVSRRTTPMLERIPILAMLGRFNDGDYVRLKWSQERTKVDVPNFFESHMKSGFPNSLTTKIIHVISLISYVKLIFKTPVLWHSYRVD